MDARAALSGPVMRPNTAQNEAPRPRRPHHRGGPEGPWWNTRR